MLQKGFCVMIILIKSFNDQLLILLYIFVIVVQLSIYYAISSILDYNRELNRELEEEIKT